MSVLSAIEVFKRKPGYLKENEITWRGTDLFNLADALTILNQRGGSGEDLEQTLTIGNDANQLDIANLDNLETDSITDNNGGGLVMNIGGTWDVVCGTQVNLNCGGNLTILGGEMDASAMTGFFLSPTQGVKTETITSTGSSLLVVGGGLKTDLGTLIAQGVWKLGDLVVGASVLDGTKYIEVEVGGTVHKLCIAV